MNVHDVDDQLLPCDKALTAAAQALGLAAGHAFANVRTMTPAPNTVAMTRTMLAYLAADGWFLVRMSQGGDAGAHDATSGEVGPSKAGMMTVPYTKTEATIATLSGLVRDLTDPDDCHYDHTGFCQIHEYMSYDECPHARAKEFLTGFDAKRDTEVGP